MKNETPLWKWGLLIVFGSVLFLLLSQFVPIVGSFSNEVWSKSILLFVGGLFVLGLYAIYVKLFEKRRVSELSAKRFFPDLLTGFVIGTLFIAVVVFVLALVGVYKIDSIGVNWVSLVLDFAALFIVAVSEEIVFRGIVFRMIKDRFNLIAAFIISSLLFGFIHLGAVDLWTSVAISVEGGFMLAAAYNFRNNLWIPIGIHWAWNFISGTVFGLDISGTIQESGLIVPKISGSYILSGGSNGFEGSIITCICGGLLAFVLLHYRKKLVGTNKSFSD